MYNSFSELIGITRKRHIPIWKAVIEEETELTGASAEKIYEVFSKRFKIMEQSAKKALGAPQPTVANLVSGFSVQQWSYAENGRTICGGLINRAMAYALSGIEVNASMGKICAAPTAGSCGILPAVLISLRDEFDLPEETVIHGLITAAGIGSVITQNATVSGAEGGCQAECGAAGAMAAAAAVEMMGHSPEDAMSAFSIALINIMGLVCDPLAGLVQIPCAQRNASQAINALISADLAIGGMVVPVPPDQVLDAMFRTGKMLPEALRETAQGGIAATPRGMEIAEKIFGERKLGKES
ncbi:MAG: L-serine ammonia-lyase, iron-sulfur-dependent, subunit alpha [Oscillospiraceae bacterium]|nr:L-serine ammonia-lyase, iron-sulfur-dependent, subunit alpha [Oscillospiraceae bacterium]